MNEIGLFSGEPSLKLRFAALRFQIASSWSKTSRSSLGEGWRRDRDSNPGDPYEPTRVPGEPIRPLWHLSVLD